MKRAIIIGCPGSGKSCFARKLHKKTGLPLFHLDMIYHRPDKTTVSREEFDSRLAEIMAHDSWIIDGNYGRTLERRLAACDTVFLFDLPTEVCLEGVEARRGVERSDMPWVEIEPDPELRQYIRDFQRNYLPKIYEKVEVHEERLNVIIFKSRAKADGYIDKI